MLSDKNFTLLQSIGDQAKDAYKSAKGAVGKGLDKLEDAAGGAKDKAKDIAGDVYALGCMFASYCST